MLPLARLAPLALATLPAAQGPPNVLVVMTDQHHPRALGVQGNGFGGLTASLTPSLDAVAAGGVRFTRAYCDAGQCMPARFTLLTGVRPQHHGLRINKVWEPRDQLTLPALARRFGYVTATIGKHHLLWLDQPPPLEEDHGFDLIVDREDYVEHCKVNGERIWTDPERVRRMPGLPAGHLDGYTLNSNEFHPAGYFAERALEFLDARAGPGGDGRPFALWLSFYGPHEPILPSGPPNVPDWAHLHGPPATLDLPPNVDKVADTQRLAKRQATWSVMGPDQHRELLSYYYGLVSQIDWNVGRVLARLEALGLAANTIVVFTADHGEGASEMGVWTKGFGAYESLQRVPLILRLPRVLPAGLASAATAGHADLFPTLVELTGLTPTEAERRRLDGRSLLPALAPGGPPPDWPDAAYSRFGHPLVASTLEHWSITTPTRKYVFDQMAGGEEQLFDLDRDPWEETNVVASPAYAADMEQLRVRLWRWWGDGADHAPLYRVTGDEDRPPPRSVDPDPPHGTLGVPRDVDLGWVPATSASRQVVLLGTAPDQLVAVEELGPLAARWDPGVLEPAATYWWRVDARNAHGTTPGVAWTFTTGAAPDGPRAASRPSPPDGADGEPRTPTLTWTVGAGVQRQALWFGPVGEPLVHVADLSAAASSWSTPQLDAGRAYRWRVDGEDLGGVAQGSPWRFRVHPAGLPKRVREPLPAHLAHDVVLPAGGRLQWKAVGGSLGYDVHFGTGFPLPLRARVGEPWYEPGPLELGRTYYWRVDTVGAAGVTTGFTWRFAAAP